MHTAFCRPSGVLTLSCIGRVSLRPLNGCVGAWRQSGFQGFPNIDISCVQIGITTVPCACKLYFVCSAVVSSRRGARTDGTGNVYRKASQQCFFTVVETSAYPNPGYSLGEGSRYTVTQSRSWVLYDSSRGISASLRPCSLYSQSPRAFCTATQGFEAPRRFHDGISILNQGTSRFLTFARMANSDHWCDTTRDVTSRCTSVCACETPLGRNETP